MLLWQLAGIAKTDPRRVRPMITAFLLASATSAYVSWRFIFAIPVVFSAVLAACLGAALYLARGQGLDPRTG